MNTINIGLVQMRCEKGTLEDNLATIQSYLQQAANRNVDILCFPDSQSRPDWERVSFLKQPRPASTAHRRRATGVPATNGGRENAIKSWGGMRVKTASLSPLLHRQAEAAMRTSLAATSSARTAPVSSLQRVGQKASSTWKSPSCSA